MIIWLFGLHSKFKYLLCQTENHHKSQYTSRNIMRTIYWIKNNIEYCKYQRTASIRYFHNDTITMNSSDTFAESIGKKVNKVRWKPEDLMASTIFVTGSWDNEAVLFLLRDWRVLSIAYAYRVLGQRRGTVGIDCRRCEFGQRVPSKTPGFSTTGRRRDSNQSMCLRFCRARH